MERGGPLLGNCRGATDVDLGAGSRAGEGVPGAHAGSAERGEIRDGGSGWDKRAAILMGWKEVEAQRAGNWTTAGGGGA